MRIGIANLKDWIDLQVARPRQYMFGQKLQGVIIYKTVLVYSHI